MSIGMHPRFTSMAMSFFLTTATSSLQKPHFLTTAKQATLFVLFVAKVGHVPRI